MVRTENTATSDLVFSPCTIGSLSLRNRIVMAPMNRVHDSSGNPVPLVKKYGVPSDNLIEHFRLRARGGTALILSGGICIESEYSRSADSVTRFETNEQIAQWARVVSAVHGEGALFAPQLWHMGLAAPLPVGPSGFDDYKQGQAKVRIMDEQDIEDAIQVFVHAVVNAVQIGCDAIEIHGAHGFLIDNFMNKHQNRRTDCYGGTMENRMKFPCDLLRHVRDRVNREFPILFRFNLHGESKEELAVIVSSLAGSGADILDLSSNDALAKGFDDGEGETMIGTVRRLSGIPVMAVGGIGKTVRQNDIYAVGDPSPAFSLIEKHEADLLGVGKGLLANPDWVDKVQKNEWRSLRPFIE